MGQLQVDSKSNEITAIPQLIELLDIAGCIITIDAMGCQKEIATKIIDLGADYVLALKGNQGKLDDAVSRWFERASSNSFDGIEHSYHQTTESGHGRIEIRQYWSVPVSQLGVLPNQQAWAGLQSVGIVVSTETEIITQPFKKIPRLRQISPIEGCVIIYSHPLM